MNTIVLWRVAHILFVAVWFGASLTIGSDAKTALKERANGGALLMQRASKAFQRSFAALILTFGSGMGLLFAKGGFKAVDPKVHMVIGLTLLIILVRAALGMPALARLRKGVNGSDEDAADAESAGGKLSMAMGIEHLLFLVGLFLMVAAVYWTKA
jgi:hypothetical protein